MGIEDLPSDELLPDDVLAREVKIWLHKRLEVYKRKHTHANIELRIQDGSVVIYKEQYSYKVSKTNGGGKA